MFAKTVCAADEKFIAGCVAPLSCGYWVDESRKYVFGYTSERSLEGWYFAVQYWFNKSLGAWKRQRECKFRKRWMAKDRAYKWLCRKEGTEFKSLHVVSEAKKKQGKRLQEIIVNKKEEISQAAEPQILSLLQLPRGPVSVDLPSDADSPAAPSAVVAAPSLTIQQKAARLKLLVDAGVLNFLNITPETRSTLDILKAGLGTAAQHKWLLDVYGHLEALIAHWADSEKKGVEDGS